MGGAAVYVDVGAVGMIVDIVHVHIKPVQQPLCRNRCGTVGTVHQHPEIVGLALDASHQIANIKVH